VERYKFQSFPFHLVEQSPWPIVTSFTLFLMACSAVLFFHGFPFGGEILILGFMLTISSMALWFKDVILEGTYLGFHTSQVQKGLYLGFILFLISEIMLFTSVFWSLFHSALVPNIEIGLQWPPLGIQTLNPLAIPLLNTILLLSSGACVTWGHHALISGKRSAAIFGTFFYSFISYYIYNSTRIWIFWSTIFICWFYLRNYFLCSDWVAWSSCYYGNSIYFSRTH